MVSRISACNKIGIRINREATARWRADAKRKRWEIYQIFFSCQPVVASLDSSPEKADAVNEDQLEEENSTLSLASSNSPRCSSHEKLYESQCDLKKV